MIPFEREVNETLWYAIMKDYDGFTYGVDGDVCKFSNDVFEVRPYDWSEPGDNSWHFWHKPSGFKLAWYKYPLRSPEVNFEISHEQFYAILHDCMNSVHPKYTTSIDKWWEKYSIMNIQNDAPNKAIILRFKKNAVKNSELRTVFNIVKRCFKNRLVMAIPDDTWIESMRKEDLQKLRFGIDSLLAVIDLK